MTSMLTRFRTDVTLAHEVREEHDGRSTLAAAGQSQADVLPLHVGHAGIDVRVCSRVGADAAVKFYVFGFHELATGEDRFSNSDDDIQNDLRCVNELWSQVCIRFAALSPVATPAVNEQLYRGPTVAPSGDRESRNALMSRLFAWDVNHTIFAVTTSLFTIAKRCL